MKNFNDFLNFKIDELKKNDLYREQIAFDEEKGARAIINGKEYLLFCSSDYLGLGKNEIVRKFSSEMILKYGFGSSGSRLLSGTFLSHLLLEKELARLGMHESSVFFNSGYMANIGVFQSIFDKSWTVFSDELNHRSVIDGLRLSKANIVVYKHSDIDDLMSKIESHKKNKRENDFCSAIVSDSVFSIDGDVANIPLLYEIAKKENLLLVLDDAHGIGVIGKGRGSIGCFDLEPKDFLVVTGSLSKALGASGGYVLGSELFCSYIRNTAKTFVYTTSNSAAVADTLIFSIKFIESNYRIFEKLYENVNYFRDKLSEFCDLNFQSIVTPIISISLGLESNALRVSKCLFERGIVAPSIRYPTVARNDARIRLTVTALHTKSDIDYFCREFREILMLK